MGLSPIPSRMLHDTAIIKVLKSMDRYQNKEYDEIIVEHVHLQSDTDVVKRANDTEVQLKGILFVDCRRSAPDLDYNALQKESLLIGDTMRVVIKDAGGNETGDFAILTVDGVPDVPATRTHHWELGLI